MYYSKRLLSDTSSLKRFLNREDPLEKGMATHPSILAWETQGQRSLVGYSPNGREESEISNSVTAALVT